MEGSQYLKRRCPICQINTYRANGKVASEITAESLGFDELIPGWNGFFKEKVFFSYERCERCALLYAPTFFNESQLERLYAQMPPNMDEVPLEALRRTQKGYFDSLKRHSDLKGGYIEVGPDIGLFTENCVREGSFDKYWLFEPNIDVKPNLDRLMQGKPTHVIHEMFGFDQVPNGAASVAVMVHVLDHLLDPVATLKELRQKLAPESRLLLVTHDESSLLRRLVGWRWPAFCMQHPQLYSPASMQSLLTTAGFSLIAQHKTINHFQIKFLLKHLLWALGWKVKSVPSFWNLTVGLKLGNMLTVAAPLEEKS